MTKNQLALIGVILFCFAQGAWAQSNQINIQKNHCEQFDDQFVLDLNAVPNGFLYNRVYPTANLENLEQCDTSHTETITQAWWEMENSNLDPNRILNYPAVSESLRIITLKPYLPIIGIDYLASAFDSLAFHDGRIVMEDEQYVIMQNVNPYHTFHAQFIPDNVVSVWF